MIRSDQETIASYVLRANAPHAVQDAARRLLETVLGAAVPVEMESPANVFRGPTRAQDKAKRDAEELKAKRIMHAACWLWNVDHTADRFAPFGRCDCGCGQPFRSFKHGECDHWIERSQGGSHTRENGWRLRAECHRKKTDKIVQVGGPNWNFRRQCYCQRAGIPFVSRKEAARG